ncbi:aldehyde dehydrogenase family protein [Rhodococcus sp. SJ-3]|uniref:aldehyde dehydrogenase family protein n=1 Tax=Rhodococcus sp. SJ-3 TaxID=3454628 RepID=UPI003F79C452
MTPDMAGADIRLSDDEFRSLDPATGDEIDRFRIHDERAVQTRVDRARSTSAWWQHQGATGRAEHLRRWRTWIWRHADEVVDLLHRENGKPRDDAFIEVVLTVEHMRWAEENAARALTPPKSGPGLLFANYTTSVEYVPLGVVGIISPWNYPLYAPNSSVSFALAAGNTVVLKPSEYTPAVAAWYVEGFYRANPHAPLGIVGLTTGFGETGALLCNSGVDKIGFTGSTRTGKKIMEQCARTLTPVLLECGGKDPVVVAEDADLRAAARAIAWGAFSNAGQTCVGVERVYVVGGVRDKFLTELRRQLEQVRPGSGDDATYGPMTMPAQIEVVRRHIDAAVKDGGQLLLGGPESVGERYIEPVVILDTAEESDAVREETFGPTVTVRTVSDVDAAVKLANASDFALGASVFSRRRGVEIAEQLRAGQVSINSVVAFAGMGAVPMGGVGESGFGRVHGIDGMREFVRTRSVVRQRFSLPGFELIALRRKAHVLPILRRVLGLRHGR